MPPINRTPRSARSGSCGYLGNRLAALHTCLHRCGCCIGAGFSAFHGGLLRRLFSCFLCGFGHLLGSFAVIIAAVAYLPFIRLSHFLLHLPGEYPKPRVAAGFFIRRQAKQPEGCHLLRLLPAAFISCASAPLCRCPNAFPAP